MMKLFTRSMFSMLPVLLFFWSCRKDITEPVQISGTWIEASARQDTLVFGYDNLLELKRGKQLMTTFLLPKANSGLYKYTLKADSIGLDYLLSNTTVSKHYYFKMEENKLSIGDFYQKYPGQSRLLAFERME